MCGIYGEFFTQGGLSHKQDFLKSNDLNRLRGPDMSGYWKLDDICQFGFRRLSIIDLTAEANQPMVSFDNRFVMVFNGEIYNFKALQASLKTLGVPFRTESDSEVLINSIAYFGMKETLSQIDGMFAFAVFDVEEKQIHLVRDFAGIKPLFYGFLKGQLVFGSRYDQVSKHPLFKNRGIDLKVLKTYLKRHYMPAPLGIINDTYQLEPGEWLTVNLNGILEKQFYWQLPKNLPNSLITDETEALKILKASLTDSVAQELVSDVSTGTFLSGGIDSPIITYLAKQKKEDLKAFCIGSDSLIHDESEDAMAYAKEIDCKIEIDIMNAEKASGLISDAMLELGEPFADISLIPTYLLCRFGKIDKTVMLSGDGGDELFFGYERFESVTKNKKYLWIPKPFRYLAYGLDKLFFNKNHVNECLLAKSLGKAHEGLQSRFSNSLLESIFPTLKDVDEVPNVMYNYEENLDDLAFLHGMRRAEFYDMMQKTLVKVDRMSMANSLEVRVPFLKKSVIETALKIHPKLIFKNKEKKWLLKRLLSDLIQGAPFNNQKRGFSIPLGMWLRQDLKQTVYETVFNSTFIMEFGINENELRTIWDQHQEEIKDHKWVLFTLYSLAIWYQEQKG